MDKEPIEHRLRRYAQGFRKEANPRPNLASNLIANLDKPRRRDSAVPSFAMAGLVLVAGGLIAFVGYQLHNIGRATASPPVSLASPTPTATPQTTTTPTTTASASASATASASAAPVGDVPQYVPGLMSIQMLGSHLGWAVGSHGIYSTSDGSHWSRQYNSNDQFVGLDFISTTTGWAVGTQSLLGTTDGGRSWQQLGEAQQWIRSVHFVNSNNGWGIAGGTQPAGGWGIEIPSMGAQIIVTSDGGRTWSSINSPADPQSICFSDAAHGWLTTEEGVVYRSGNGGQSWTPSLQMAAAQQGLPGKSRLECAAPSAAWVEFSSGGAAAGNIPYIVYATVNGSSWRAVMEEQMTMQQAAPGVPWGPGSYPGAFSVVDPNDAVFVGDTPPANRANVMIASNGGASLQSTGSIPGPSETYDAAFVSTSNGWVLEVNTSNQVVIERTTDGGYHWSQQLAVPNS